MEVQQLQNCEGSKLVKERAKFILLAAKMMKKAWRGLQPSIRIAMCQHSEHGKTLSLCFLMMMLGQTAGNFWGRPGSGKQGPVVNLHAVQLGLTLTLLKC